jgi:nucleoside-diphosphate-sugar epimerase
LAVLVTGGAGFIGSYVVRDLLARGERTVLYDSNVTGNALDLVLAPEQSHEALTVVSGPITDTFALLRVCEDHGVDRVVHLASPLTQDFTANPPAGIRDICEATAGILEISRALSIRRVVWASSVAIFGRRSQYPPGAIAGDAAHRPETLYGSCKSLCEAMARRYRDADGVDSIGLRLTVVYGAGRLRGYMSFPSDMIRRAALGESVAIPIGDQAMNWQYVEEVSAMFLRCLDAETPRDVAFNTYGDTRTFREAAEILTRLAPDIRISVSNEAGDDGHVALQQMPVAYDDSALRDQIGYIPAYPLERGIEQTYESFLRLQSADTPPARNR